MWLKEVRLKIKINYNIKSYVICSTTIQMISNVKSLAPAVDFGALGENSSEQEFTQCLGRRYF